MERAVGYRARRLELAPLKYLRCQVLRKLVSPTTCATGRQEEDQKGRLASHRTCRPTDRRSAASNSADRTRSCRHSMPPCGTQGQLNRAVDGPLQRACWTACDLALGFGLVASGKTFGEIESAALTSYAHSLDIQGVWAGALEPEARWRRAPPRPLNRSDHRRWSTKIGDDQARSSTAVRQSSS